MAFNAPIDVVAEGLKGLANITKVETKEKSGELARFLVEARKGCDIRPDLFKIATEKNWPLFELREDQLSLEEIFSRLTQV